MNIGSFRGIKLTHIGSIDDLMALKGMPVAKVPTPVSPPVPAPSEASVSEGSDEVSEETGLDTSDKPKRRRRH